MPSRDPQTGQFVSGQSFEDVETVTWKVDLSVAAAELTGATDSFYGNNQQFDGILLYDLDDMVDRHEVGDLLTASHVLNLQPTGTQTADSAALASVEISGSPTDSCLDDTTPSNLEAVADQGGTQIEVTQRTQRSDSLDVVGRPLSCMAQGPFTDGTTGTGGGGGPGHDWTEVHPIDFSMDRRDEMYLNGRIEAQNISDGPVTATVIGQHVYSITHD